MHKIGEYVNYGTEGVCRIEDIRAMSFGKGGEEREYYILQPIGQGRSSVFVPVDNARLTGRMRPILTRQEIEEVVQSAKARSLDWISDRKERMEQFQKIMSERDERQLLLLIGCLEEKARRRGRGISAAETQLLKKAENAIEQEFAFALQVSPQEISRYLQAQLGQALGA